jgi:hypothetical protein
MHQSDSRCRGTLLIKKRLHKNLFFVIFQMNIFEKSIKFANQKYKNWSGFRGFKGFLGTFLKYKKNPMQFSVFFTLFSATVFNIITEIIEK